MFQVDLIFKNALVVVVHSLYLSEGLHCGIISAALYIRNLYTRYCFIKKKKLKNTLIMCICLTSNDFIEI